MKIRVLGSAAGGGFPQWNCGCENCLAVRRGSPEFRARTEESIVVSADSRRWFLVNATPEVRRQLDGFSPLHPRSARDFPVAGIILTNGDLDHCLGLLALRESQPLTIYATNRVRDGFTRDNVLYRTLERFPGQVTWKPLEIGRTIPLDPNDDTAPPLVVEAVAMPGKLPIHLEGRTSPHAEDNVALLIHEARTGRTVAYAPAVAGPNPAVARLATSDCVFFDGTFWSDDELSRQGLGDKRAKDMAHWPVGGSEGSLRFLASHPTSRRILINVNNTNPILRESSHEAAEVRGAGVEIAHDGMEIDL